MSTIVFVGPTLSASQVRKVMTAEVWPPAAAGDMLRAFRSGATCIGMIDGYFDRVAAVRHKEILWVMREGVRVYGSASMGALRAAELSALGMVGVGKIFNRYRDGSATRDDEVAMVHGPVDSGYVALSEPLVNIRATVAAAEAAGVLSAATARLAIRVAEEAFYPDRSYPLLIEAIRRDEATVDEAKRFGAWLPDGAVDLKRADALAMLRRMRDDSPDPPETSVFPRTVYWEQLAAAVDLEPTDDTGTAALLDELRLDGAAYQRVLADTRLRELALDAARRIGLSAERIIPATRDRFLAAHGIADPDERARWLRHNGLTERDLERLVREEALLRLLLVNLHHRVEQRLADQLIATGAFGRMRARARRKAHVVALSPRSRLASDGAVLHWFFTRLNRPVPADLDTWAETSGWPNRHEMLRALHAEYIYTYAPGYP